MDKSYFELYAPYFSVIISLIALLVSIIMSFVQMKASKRLMKQDNLIKLRKEWIQDFIKLASEIYEFLLFLNNDSVKHSNTRTERIGKIENYIAQLSLRNTIDGTNLFEITDLLKLYIKEYSEIISLSSSTQFHADQEEKNKVRKETSMKADSIVELTERIMLEFISRRNIETMKLTG